MIVVLADDFSGAAELAGIAAGRGLAAEVQTRFDPTSQADLVAVDTDTRLRTEKEAVAIVGATAAEVAAIGPEWIYKKTDSVLRGHVAAEIGAILETTGLRRCLCVPSNPSRQRVISGGRYFIDGVPLSKTGFRRDPDFPRTSDRIEDLLAGDESIQVPDVATLEDIPNAVDESTLPAGAADFFAALLGGEDVEPRRRTTKRTLLVCGSLAAWDDGREDQMKERGFLVTTIEENVTPSLWEQSDRIMLAIGRPGGPAVPSFLPALVEKAVRLLDAVDDLRTAVEGGATAISLIRAKGWERFRVLPEGHVGVGSLLPERGPVLGIKPGSYPWPESLFPDRAG